MATRTPSVARLLRHDVGGVGGILPAPQLPGNEGAEFGGRATGRRNALLVELRHDRGSRMMRFTSALSRSTIAFGVPAVVNRPTQATASKPGNPLSATVGRAGKCGSRSALPEASGRNPPALIWASEANGDITVNCTSPATVPSTAGAPPRYGMCCISMPASPLHSATRR